MRSAAPAKQAGDSTQKEETKHPNQPVNLLASAIKLIRTPALQWRTNALGLHLQKASNASPQSRAHNLGAKCFSLLKVCRRKARRNRAGLVQRSIRSRLRATYPYSLAIKSLSRFGAGSVANLSRASSPKFSRAPQLKICVTVQLAYRASPSNFVVPASPKSIAIRNGAVL
jgi:hypothetical protein